MSGTIAIIITLALILYTAAVWGERIGKRLKLWHLLLFIAGLIFDGVGTGMMFKSAGGISFTVHGLVGIVAIFLMFVNVVWAILAYFKKDEIWKIRFHQFSIIVWCLWLFVYISPVFFMFAKK
jgi:uncharacterized repeat protein (TIGR03987 family)